MKLRNTLEEMTNIATSLKSARFYASTLEVNLVILDKDKERG